MSYVITLTENNKTLTTIQDGTVNTQTGLSLIGRNYTNYGDALNQNFVKLLENFADTISPDLSTNIQTILTGTLWYDTGNDLLKVYDGSQWYPVSQRIVSNVAPTADTIGDQWWDTANQQLNAWTGTEWLLIGPQHTVGQGLSGSVVELITDTSGVTHTVVNTYANDNLISVTSYDASFTASPAIAGIAGNIVPGVNLISTAVFNGNATNSQLFNGLTSSQFARADVDTSLAGNVAIGGKLSLSNGSMQYANNNINIQNTTLDGGMNVYVNSPSGNITALSVSGTTGLVTVYGDPQNSTHVATKNYVDNSVNGIVGAVQNVSNNFYTQLSSLVVDYEANVNIINTAIGLVNNNVQVVQNQINSNVIALTDELQSISLIANTSIAQLQSNVASIGLTITDLEIVLAPLYSPALTGTPTAPTVTAATNYLQSIAALYNTMQFNQTRLFTVGDYITQYDPNSGKLLSNVQVVTTTSTVGFDATTILTAGKVVAGNSSILVAYNGNLVSGLTVISYTPTGTTPTFMGLNDTATSGGTTVATTGYVDLTANLVYSTYQGQFASLSTELFNSLVANIGGVATLASPAFTGTPTAPTPVFGDTSGNIATASFVQSAVSSATFNYSVATTAPGDNSGGVSSTNSYAGNNGDFWFQIG